MAQIKTPTGYKDLSTIMVGDEVCAFDTAVNIVEAIDLWTAEANDYENQGDFIYYLVNGIHKFYKNQSIYVNDIVSHAFMIQVGDIIYDEYDQDIVVTSIEELTNETEWYRLTISGDHTYIVDNIILHNASRYWVGGGSSVNWNATANTNWAATSGGANNQSVPTSADDVIFDTTASPATISATITILTFTKTAGYTGTITRSAVLTVAGNFTDNTASAWAGTQGLQISATSIMTSGGVTWGAPLTFNGTSTKTLLGNWSVTLLSIIGGTTTLNKTTTETLTATGGMSIGNGFNGTADVILTGGTWSGSSSFGCATLTIAGNVTINSGTNLGTSTLTYSSGTVTVSAGTFTLSGNCTLNNIAGITWSSISTTNASTCTLNSLLTMTGTLSIFAGSSFTGTAGFTCGTLTGGAGGVTAATTTLQAGITYTVTSALTINSSRVGAINTFTSSSPTVKAILTLSPGATCNVLSNFTRIDSSAGRTIRSFNGTITDCLNIVAFNDLPVSGF
jgi:hypothetical protein